MYIKGLKLIFGKEDHNTDFEAACVAVTGITIITIGLALIVTIAYWIGRFLDSFPQIL